VPEEAKKLILVVDDEPRMIQFIRMNLELEGYRVTQASNGLEALNKVRDELPDLVILDVMMPGLDGLEVCRQLRASPNGDVPILMLTAKDAVPDRVAGLDAGADDYLVKPFAFNELLARIRALLRRRQVADGDQVISFADLMLNSTTHEVARGNRSISLTAKEFDLLELFMRHPRQVLTRDIIYERVWGYDFGGESNIVEVYIRYLRAKLEADGAPRLLQTVRGVGYALREE
jgi:two-component system response regulator MprA